jgi:hypothetical protein
MTSRIDEMRAQIHATPMRAPVPAWWQRWHRAGLISGGILGLGLVAAAAILVFAIGDGSDASPAFAAIPHTRGGQRTVTITLREEKDLPKLNARLRAEHTRIRVVPVVRGCDDPVHLTLHGKEAPGPAKTMLAHPQYMDGKQVFISQETIAVDTEPGRTFVVPDSRTGFINGGGGTVIGPAPSCTGIGARVNLGKGFLAG